MRCEGHRVASSRSATVCRLSAAAQAGPCAPDSALAAPGAIARWKRLGRSTTKKRMAVVLGSQDGARKRRDMPGALSQHADNAPTKGHGLCGRHRCNEAARRKSPHTTMAKTAKAAPTGRQLQQGLGWTGPGLAQGNPRPGSGRQEAWQAAAVMACWVSLQQLALSTLGLRK